MFGKISVGVLNTAMPPKSTIRMLITTKVKGRRSATRTRAFIGCGRKKLRCASNKKKKFMAVADYSFALRRFPRSRLSRGESGPNKVDNTAQDTHGLKLIHIGLALDNRRMFNDDD